MVLGGHLLEPDPAELLAAAPYWPAQPIAAIEPIHARGAQAYILIA